MVDVTHRHLLADMGPLQQLSNERILGITVMEESRHNLQCGWDDSGVYSTPMLPRRGQDPSDPQL